MSPVEPAAFAARLDALGPFEPAPRIAVAASGGADSTALALLAWDWAQARGGDVLALVVDHGLRAEAADEAGLTACRLAARGIAARVLTLRGLLRGPALAARARQARYGALEQACAEAGIVHLLLGHHAGDQAETVEMRARSASGAAGLAAMSAVRETRRVRLLRPLLGAEPASLRATARAAGMAWIDDPSNHDRTTVRARLRAEMGMGDVADRVAQARRHATERSDAERRTADLLARSVVFAPLGYAIVAAPLPPDAWASVVTTIAGTVWPPARSQLERLAVDVSPCTIGGVRILRAGRLAPGGWLIARESAAMASSVAARAGATWDGRFRLRAGFEGARLGALGADCIAVRDGSALPRAVLETLPALTRDGAVIAIPHLGLGTQAELSSVLWEPSRPATSAPFAPA